MVISPLADRRGSENNSSSTTRIEGVSVRFGILKYTSIPFGSTNSVKTTSTGSPVRSGFVQALTITFCPSGRTESSKIGLPILADREPDHGVPGTLEHCRVQFLAERKQNRPPHQGHAAFLHHPTPNESPVHRHGDG
jgi:hypothetical protein